jgi:hypothetical protein
MSRRRFRSIYRIALVIPLLLAALVRVPFADGLLLHDHGDQSIHSHTVMLDDLREGDLRVAWHRHHDGIHHDHHDNKNDDSSGGENAHSLLVFVSDPAIVAGFHCVSGKVSASVRRPSTSVLPRSMLPGDSPDASRLSAAQWPSAHPLRPAFALDALLQSSHALLL